MRYWWVNQNQTFKHETTGGYMWSPKRNKAPEGRLVGSKNRFYQNMKEVSPGDVVLSFNNTKIPAIGIIQSYGFSAPQPGEFGKTGQQWADQGWRVEVDYKFLTNIIKPKDHIQVLRPLLPPKYAPLQRDTGDGLQGVYLAELNKPLADRLFHLIGTEADQILELAGSDLYTDSDTLELETAHRAEDANHEMIQQRDDLQPTVKKTLIEARRGQGKYKSNVRSVESACRLTGVTNISHLIASHIKPWRYSNDQEKLDGYNGLLLTPSIDHLFDRGFISFGDNGDLLISPVADLESLRRLSIDIDNQMNVGGFTTEQITYLAYHRAEVFKKVDDE